MPFSEEYNPVAMDHFLNPRNAGEIPGASCIGIVRNSKCGDMIKLSLNIRDGVILEARARTFGCAAAIASASVLTELLRGASLDRARTLKNSDIVAALQGLPEHKIECSVFAEEAVREALSQFRPPTIL